MTLVKVCGIKSISEAQIARDAGVWAIGLVFAPSPRRVEATEAARICSSIADGPLKIGVFVDEAPERIRTVAALCRLDAVQLHGEENPLIIQELDTPVIKSFPVDGPLPPDLFNQWRPWAYHFDSKSKGPVRGGTGTVFNWNYLQGVPSQTRFIVSGGLNPENVSAVIRSLKPWAVDVSSGVEYPGGGKNPEAIFQFVARVKEEDAYAAC